ncbi:MAG: LuxR C-terminal-related transcriptional regulator [Pseudonocardia sp.]|nr:LuxR C-terminal-related transcriptional regulator [Pseudonocardia sp.]
MREPDVNKWVQLARAARPAASMSAATAGDLDRSLRQREIRGPGGFAGELRVVLAGSTGTWGELTVFREVGRPYFTAAEVAFVSSVASAIADGLRRAQLLDAAQAGRDGVGVLVLDAADGIQMPNRAAEHWLDRLGASDRPGARLPVVIPAVARQARATCGAVPADLRPATARVRAGCGQWLIVRGSLLGDGPEAPVTVLIESARRAEMAPLMVAAYGFTAAERHVTELVAQGLPTRQIANRLQVTIYTVQDHLKSIFAKSGTASRGDLVARLFVDHHAVPLTAG